MKSIDEIKEEVAKASAILSEASKELQENHGFDEDSEVIRFLNDSEIATDMSLDHF